MMSARLSGLVGEGIAVGGMSVSVRARVGEEITGSIGVGDGWAQAVKKIETTRLALIIFCRLFINHPYISLFTPGAGFALIVLV